MFSAGMELAKSKIICLRQVLPDCLVIYQVTGGGICLRLGNYAKFCFRGRGKDGNP